MMQRNYDQAADDMVRAVAGLTASAVSNRGVLAGVYPRRWLAALLLAAPGLHPAAQSSLWQLGSAASGLLLLLRARGACMRLRTTQMRPLFRAS